MSALSHCPSWLWSRSSSALTWPSERSSPFVIFTLVVFELLIFLSLHYNWSDLLKIQIPYICVCLVIQSCPTLCNPMNYSLLGSSVLEISQARILEWVAISSFRRSSWPRDRTWTFCIMTVKYISVYTSGLSCFLSSLKGYVQAGRISQFVYCKIVLSGCSKARNAETAPFLFWSMGGTRCLFEAEF